MILTTEEFKSSIWRKIKVKLIADLADARLDNDKTSNSTQSTDVLRGRIKQLKLLIDLEPTESESLNDSQQ